MLQRKLSVPMIGLHSRDQFSESFTTFQSPFGHQVPMPSTSRIYERKISLPCLTNPNNSLDDSINSMNASLNSLGESLSSIRQPLRRQSMPILPTPSYLDWPANNQNYQMMAKYNFRFIVVY
jgi:hypothetical protein